MPFVMLGLALDRSFFEDWGWLVGPVIWLAGSVVTARILSMPIGYVLFSAVAGGVAGADRLPGRIPRGAAWWPALLVFAASCGSYDPEAEEQARREWEQERAAQAEREATARR